MEFSLNRLGPAFKKQESPPCACCGYDADWIIKIGSETEGKFIVRMFCERDMRDALLDAMNFSTAVPDCP